MASGSQSLPAVEQSRPICCKIVDTETASFTNYVIRVKQGFGDDENTWTVKRRYREFCQLQSELAAAGLPVELPAKQLFGKTNQNFINERRIGLQKFLDLLMGHLMVSVSVHVWRFVYPGEYKDMCAEAMLMAVRNLRAQGWQFAKSWRPAGWRLNKAYALLHAPVTQAGSKRALLAPRLLSWTPAPTNVDVQQGPVLDALRWLCTVDLPFILRPHLCEPSGSGVMVVYTCLAEGTLRDHFCRAKPDDSYLKKYSNPETVYPLGLDDIRYVGRHLLEALAALHKLGIPHGNVHAGNIAVAYGKQCVLTDVESGLLRLKSYYWPLLIQLKGVQTLEQLDMYCFGQAVFELATGDALMQPCIPYGAQLACHSSIQTLLYTLLTEEAIQQGLPSVNDMLKHELFASAPVLSSAASISMSASVHRAMQQAGHAIVQQLRHDQLQFRRSVRSIKFESWLNSEQYRKQKQRVVREGNNTLSAAEATQKEQPAAAAGLLHADNLTASLG